MHEHQDAPRSFRSVIRLGHGAHKHAVDVFAGLDLAGHHMGDGNEPGVQRIIRRHGFATAIGAKHGAQDEMVSRAAIRPAAQHLQSVDQATAGGGQPGFFDQFTGGGIAQLFAEIDVESYLAKQDSEKASPPVKEGEK